VGLILLIVVLFLLFGGVGILHADLLVLVLVAAVILGAGGFIVGPRRPTGGRWGWW
jgi:hypothetical protein